MKTGVTILSGAAMAAANLSSPLALAGNPEPQSFKHKAIAGNLAEIEASTSISPASNYARQTPPDLRKHLQLAESLERNPRG